MIHRDNRAPWESSSTLGQIIWRSGPRGNFGGGDVDYYWHQSGEHRADGRAYLRVFEHKQVAAKEKHSQSVTLDDLALLIDHGITCPESPVLLDPRSGLYLVRGPLTIQDNGRKGTCFGGPQEIERRGLHPKTTTVRTEAEFFRWLAAPLEGPITYRVDDLHPSRPSWWPARSSL
ncbi:MAG TPA: hypothetical protein VE953_26255 [Terriglobales bacterium]|nr:hypothetical protein [Terriglobales bacterium]